MVQRTIEKTVALLIAAAVMIVAMFFPAHKGEWGLLHLNASMAERGMWQFRHVNVFHALLNAWCLLAVTFNLHVTLRRLICLFALCAACPYVKEGQYICGLSCFTIALTASNTFNVPNMKSFLFLLAATIASGFLFHSIAAYAHIYGAALGLIWGFANETLKEV